MLLPALCFSLAAVLPLVVGQDNVDNHWDDNDYWAGDSHHGAPWSGNRGHGWRHGQPYKHMAVFSVDGLHASDIEKYLAVRPKSNISMLLETGYEYTNAYTTAPSDSFPGTMAQWTGGTAAVTGVWYDDVWDRSWYAPGSNCQGPPGAEIAYDESIDYNSTMLFSGGIDPTHLPEALVNGKCTQMYPHMRLRVNTVTEVVVSKGKQTAYTDKHPAYDILRGPSGTGLTVGYFPEQTGRGGSVAETIAYDQYHVNAYLEWLDATTPEHSEGALTEIPTLFGGNFQCMSVAQKTVGYLNTSGNPLSPAELQAMDFVDASLGAVMNKLKAKGIYRDTLIIVASKHGQAPINPSLYAKIDPKVIANATGVPVAFQTSDDIALIFLQNSSDTATAVANLNKAKTAGKILNIISGQDLIAQGFGNPATDPRVPDIIVQPDLGIIYTTSTKKIAEHGGISADDRNVACFVSSPRLRKQQFTQRVYTTQVAPVILKGLGYDPRELQAVVAQNVQALPGF